MVLDAHNAHSKTDETGKIRRYAVICSVLWTVLLSGLFIRGRISISLSLAPIQKAMSREMLQEVFIHVLIWLMGLGIIWFGARKIIRTTTLLRNERNRLHESEEKYRKLANEQQIILTNSPVGICFLKDRKVMWANQMFDIIFGYEAGTMEQMDTVELYSTKELYDVTGENAYSTIGNDAVYSQDVLMKRKDGVLIWCNLVGHALTPGSLEEGSIWIVIDITGRKRTEEALQKNEEKFSKAFNASPEAISIASMEDGKYVEVNDVFLATTGFQRDEVIGHTSSELGVWVDPSDRQKFVDELFQNGFLRNYEVRYRMKNSEIRLFLVSSELIEIASKQCSLNFIMDITERKRAEEKRLLLEQQFQHAQRLESLGVLAGGIAHDFNNILTVILGHCYLAREGALSEQEQLSSFLQIENASNRAADLCRQMLTYAGKSPLVQSEVDLRLLIDETVKMLVAAIKKNITIELDIERFVAEIKGDSGQIQQIIMNLIINAAEAIGDANGIIKVVLYQAAFGTEQTGTDIFGSAILPGNYICLEVIDTGSGMDEDTQKRIFEPFYTTKFTGRGLGMSAIHGIVTSHEGLMQVDSTPEVGTTFKVFFPIPESSGCVDAVLASPTPPKQQSSGTILLVEDEAKLCELGATLLKSMGFSTLIARNGRDALEIYKSCSGEIDVILLDLIMPVMGGAATYRELRNVAPAIPIIICSGYGIGSVENIINNDAYAAFVCKPYNPLELQCVLSTMMRL